MIRPLRAALIAIAAAVVLSGCALVPQNRRALLADPIMSFDEDTLEARSRQKFYTTREGASGGDGTAAGGGCGCQ